MSKITRCTMMITLFKEFGIDEIKQENLIINKDKNVHLYHQSDFERGGKMYKFSLYTIDRFEHEFCCCLYFAVW